MKVFVSHTRVTGQDEYFIRTLMRGEFKPDWMRHEYSGCLDAPYWIPTGSTSNCDFKKTVRVTSTKR